MSVRLQVTIEEGGAWLTIEVEPEIAAQILNDGRIFGRVGIYAVKFPGDLIYDFTNKRWRYRGWSSSTSHDLED